MDLTDNYNEINQEIQNLSSRQETVLVAVSKYQSVDKIRALYEAGHRDFGENRVQELLQKVPQFPTDMRWHLIGHLQSNKAKYIVDKVHLIHSVNSLPLATEISKQALKQGITVNILVQINVSGEESKFGCNPQEALALIRAISGLEGVKIQGLMTMAPLVGNPEDARPVFCALRELALHIKQYNIPKVNMTYLSMGMSNDYHIALAEGSNMVRIGSKLFGVREY